MKILGFLWMSMIALISLPLAAIEAAEPDQLATLVSSLNSEKDCVGYKTTKGMFLVTSVDVIGTTCEFAMTFQPSVKGNLKIRVEVPVDRFDSGNGKRDREVANILGGEQKAPMVFEAEVPSDFRNYLTTEQTIKGTFKVLGEEHQLALTMTVRRDGASEKLLFQAKTAFSALKLKVPNVGPFGMVASPRDEVLLFGQIKMPAGNWK